jgi:glucose-6-phosphate 1-epimerase
VSPHDSPHVDLLAPDGARARVYLDGAQVASWIPAGSTDDRLFVSARALYGEGQSIRGGIPICFPQFGAMGPLKQHGFARNMRWMVESQSSDDNGARVRLSLTDSDVTRAMWPYAFTAALDVAVVEASLTVSLTVTNTGSVPFAFTAALHPYFRVENAFACAVHGLGGTTYRDALRNSESFTSPDGPLAIEGHIDRVYGATPDVLNLVEPHRVLRIEKHGFPDAVVWNPGAEITASKADFAAGDEQHMVCVEAGAIGSPVVLQPGARWTGTQLMEA